MNEGINMENETLTTTSVNDENNITAESANIITIRNAYNTAEVNREETDNKPETMSNRQLMIIVAVVGAAIVIATNASICTYWKMKTRSRERQTLTIMLSDIETTTEENTHVHYYEIEDTPSNVGYDGSAVPDFLNTIASTDNFVNIPQVHYENIALTAPTELSNIIQINTMEHQDNTVPTQAIGINNICKIPRKHSTVVSTSSSSQTFRTAQEHDGFMTLADINIFDGAVADSNGPNDPPRHSGAVFRTDVECSHYENLDPTSRDANSQYTTLV
ncbi:uncharacterized protein LOC127849502 isoform X2 [Dreissena polymorpha]|uniref:uncharacterized protein LOC127849502 isoform X2 n=1 Tax=Dreissena polymorpha TaxID=45954 RepID=UPI00226446C5|nr:uncharacterized protein LOC127849502 isoform X2 [Dreissena polymorpha]